jgi:OOP family OmpA-OmpF porin
MKPLVKLVVGAGLIAMPLVNSAMPGAIPGYVTDERGVIVRTDSGECWHTSEWTPEMAVVGCDGKVADAIVEPELEPEPEMVYTPPPPVERRAPRVERRAPRVERVERLSMADDGEALFEFNKARLSGVGRARLDALIDRIRTFEQIDSVVVTGHADRLGSDNYNMNLSMRRAETVRDYLVDNQVVDAGVVSVDARGESEPVVECNNRSRKALIACLAPNRRVVIDVTGSSASAQ